MPGGLVGSGSRGGLVGIDDVGAGQIGTADIADNAVTTAKIAANAVGNTDLRDSGACSVIGRSANSAGDPADISAASNNQFLGRQTDAVAFYSLTISNITDADVNRVPYSNGSQLVSSDQLTYAAATGTFSVAKSHSGSTVTSSARNTSNTASSAAQLLAEVAGASAGDPSFKLSISGVKTYDWRIENASSDRLSLYFDSTRIASFKDTNVLLGLTTALEERLEYENTNAAFYTRFRFKASSRALDVYTFGGTFASNLFFGLTGANSVAVVSDGTSMSFGTTAAAPVVVGTNNIEALRIHSTQNVGIGTATDVATSRVRIDASRSVASAAGAVWDGIDAITSTLTVSGGTNITTATGVNMVALRAPTISAGTALTVTAAATLYVAGAPAGAGAGPATITNAYAVWVDAGLVRLDGNGTHVLELPADATVGAGTVTGRVPILVGGALKYLRYFDD